MVDEADTKAGLGASTAEGLAGSLIGGGQRQQQEEKSVRGSVQEAKFLDLRDKQGTKSWINKYDKYTRKRPFLRVSKIKQNT